MPKMVRAYLRADLSSHFRSLADMVLIVLDAIVSPARSQYVRRPDHEEVVGDPLEKKQGGSMLLMMILWGL